MKPTNNRILILSLLILIPVATLAFADVIFYYTGQINVGLAKTQPLTFTYNGQTYGPNGNVPGYILFKGSSTGFTVNLNITNASSIYFYQAGYLTVNTAGYIYVSSIGISGNNLVNSMTIYIQNAQTGATVASFTIINNGQPVTTPSSAISLSTGTYYISIYVVPKTPLPSPSSGSTESITVNFGYNIVSSSPIPQP